MAKWHTVYVGLGSNLLEPLQQVERACGELGNLDLTKFVKSSPWYRSKAIGPGIQPDYINGAAQLQTQLEPLTLLDGLQAIEKMHNRERSERWGARTLDLDLLLYDDLIIDHPRLVVPHPRIRERNFVLFPLNDLNRDLLLPQSSTNVDNSDMENFVNREALSVSQLCKIIGGADLTRL